MTTHPAAWLPAAKGLAIGLACLRRRARTAAMDDRAAGRRCRLSIRRNRMRRARGRAAGRPMDHRHGARSVFHAAGRPARMHAGRRTAATAARCGQCIRAGRARGCDTSHGGGSQLVARSALAHERRATAARLRARRPLRAQLSPPRAAFRRRRRREHRCGKALSAVFGVAAAAAAGLHPATLVLATAPGGRCRSPPRCSSWGFPSSPRFTSRASSFC